MRTETRAHFRPHTAPTSRFPGDGGRWGVACLFGSRRGLFAWILPLFLLSSLPAEAQVTESTDRARLRVLNEIDTKAQIEQKLGAQIPLDLTFIDEAGKPVEIGSFFDGTRPVILNLAYFSCPVLCNLVTNGVIDSVEMMDWEVGEQFRVITVSIDPRDTPEGARGRKESLVETLGRSAIDGWPILTGTEENVRALAEAVGFGYEWSEVQQEYAHDSGIILVSPDGKVTRYFKGIAYPAKELRLSLVEASEGKVGSLADQVFLLCFAFDPDKQTYGIRLAFLMLRIGAVTTIAALGATFFFMSRNRRRDLAARPGVRDES